MQEATLLTLETNSPMNEKIPIRFATQIKKFHCVTNTEYIFEKNCDTIDIVGIITTEWPKLRKNGIFEIKFQDNLIYSLPLALITDDHVKMSANKYVIKIAASHFNVLNGFLEIPLHILQYQQVKFNIDFNNSNDKFSLEVISYDLITEMVAMEHGYKMSWFENPMHDWDIFQYQNFQLLGTITEFEASFPSTGIYLSLRSPLIELELQFNDLRFLYLDRDLIELHDFLLEKREVWTDKQSEQLHSSLNTELPSEIIDKIEDYLKIENEYLYYLPFNRDKISYLEKVFTCTVDFSHMGAAKLHIQTESGNCYGGQFWIKNVNQLEITNGRGNIRFT